MTVDETPAIDQPEPRSELCGAGGTDRYFAAALDGVFAVILVLVVAGVLSENMPARSGTVVNAIAGFAIFGFYLAYFFLFEAFFATTPGKFALSLQIRNLDGTRPKWRAAFVRTAARLVEVNPFLLGCIPAAIIIWRSPRRQRWGDLLAGTVVVSNRSRR